MPKPEPNAHLMPWPSSRLDERHSLEVAMRDPSGPSPGPRAHQQAIRAKCVHPTGTFVEFKGEDIEQSIPQRFEKQVRQYPERLAIKTRQHAWTYTLLNQAANRIGHAIVAQLGALEEPLAFLLDKGASAIATLFGTLKAGKIYVPLDPFFPRERLLSMLAGTQPRLLLTDNEHMALARTLVSPDMAILNIDRLDAGTSTQNLGLCLAPDQLAYILYTSGSTGVPKGVVQSHRNILHQVMCITNSWHITADDRMTLFASLSSGQSRTDVYCTLLNGAGLHPFNIKAEGLTHLATWLVQEGITLYHSSASTFRAFIDTLDGHETFPYIRLIRLASETVANSDVESYQKHFSANCIFVNGLSSTETGLVCQYMIDQNTLVNGHGVPVGYAVEGKEILLLDEAGVEVGIGGEGEITVRSRYLSPGYWRRPDLTQAAFQADPADRTKRIYRTGDLGRWHPDRGLEHLGRKDFQVKVRGHRIETAEVEQMLSQHPAIRQAVVVARADDGGDTRLVAYIVPVDWTALLIGTLRHFLQERLPDYMVPSALVTLEALPQTPSGKVDRRALPAPDWSRPLLGSPFVPPRTPVEAELARIWGEVLGLAKVGIDDHFLELGGHSLLATRVISRVIEAFRVDVPLRALLEAPTVAAMAMLITQQQAALTEHADIERLLAEVEGLSTDEVRRRLTDDIPLGAGEKSMADLHQRVANLSPEKRA
jgi:amino acid adenylation domain-containing protein